MRTALAILGLTAAAAAAVAQQTEDAGEPRVAYAGRVTDADGRPVAGAIVFADSGRSYQTMDAWIETPWKLLVPDPLAHAATGPWTVRAASPSAADGTFRVGDVPTPVGDGWVLVVHPDHPPARVPAPGPLRDGTVSVGDVRLDRGCEIVATVTSAAGTPVADAWVVARPQRDAFASGGDAPGEVRISRTGADGKCTVRGLRAQSYRVAAFPAESVPAEAVVATDRAAPVACALRIEDGAHVRVEVVTRGTGAAVEGARIVIDRISDARRSWPAPPPLASARTSAAGIADIRGIEPRAEYSVVVVPPDFAGDGVHSPGPFHVAASVKPGETVRLEIDAARTLRLRLLDAYSKEPVANAKVKLVADWAAYDRTGGSPIDLAMEWDAATASYVTSQVRPGPWTILAWAPGHHPSGLTNVVVPRDGAVADERIELGPASATATGRVVAATTGEPVADAVVSTYEWVERIGDGQRASAKTGADGVFRLSNLLGSDYPIRLAVTAPGWCDEFRDLSAADRTADLGTVSLVRAGTIRGRLTDAEGRPRASAEVFLIPEGGDWRGKLAGRSTLTDADGRYEFTGLRPGAWTVGDVGGTRAVLAEGATVVCDLVR